MIDKCRCAKCRCEWRCKELIDKVRCDGEFIWNPISCECQSDKLCDFGEYLDSVNWKKKNRLFERLTEKWSEDIDRN